MADTASWTELETWDNATFQDAFEFGTAGDTSWSFTNQNFRMDIKGNADDTVPLLTLLSTSNDIVVDDAVNRILHFNVSESTLTAALTPGCYVYDLIMYDGSSPPVRVPLMRGTFELKHGVTGG